MAASRVGDVVASKYRLEELLGSGGMGHVYRALNVRAGRVVAIKILRSEHATNAAIVDRFLREALAANLVRHPNVVDVLDVDKDDDGSPYIVQELLTGEDLEKYVRSRGGRLNLAEVEELVLPVVDAVAEAHARGVVHRDIKPENVFLAQQGNKRVPKLLDFGISKIRLPNIKMTDVGVMMGTPAYIAPEQIHGGSREADPRADVWALGIVLWELLVGRLPFENANDAPALFVAIATKDVPRMIDVDPSIDPHVSRVVERCLRRALDERYPTAAELARDLRHVLAGTDIEPTQRRSIPPLAMRGAPGPALEIPDLVMPASPRLPEPTPAHPTEAMGKIELELPMEMAIPLSATAAMPRSAPASVPHLPAPASTPAAAAPPSARRVDAAAPLDGVMMSGSIASQRRPGAPAPSMYQPPPEPVPKDEAMKLLVAIGVCGLVPILTTALLMTFLYSPEGWNLVAVLMKPAQPISLIIQGGLAAVAFGVAGANIRGAFRRWRGDLAGGHGAAIVYACLAGGLLFAAMQLGRAAF
ncbi:MAG: serine/threonine-protein kinase [Labilithrix sp.]